MRERAEAAQNYDNDLPWTCVPAADVDNNGWVVTHDPSHADYDTTVAQAVYDFEGFVSQHIASWHPAIALLAADLLDTIAVGLEARGVTAHIKPSERAAFAVARAYLREQS
jgi:cytochrome P450